MVSGKHSIYTHFPKDRDCDVCLKTKITRAPCRKSTGAAIARAENFAYLITADHKVLSEGCESRNNHRYAVVVQDLATQWIQSFPLKTQTSQQTEKSLQKFFEPTWKSKVIYTDYSLELAKPVETSVMSIATCATLISASPSATLEPARIRQSNSPAALQDVTECAEQHTHPVHAPRTMWNSSTHHNRIQISLLLPFLRIVV